MPPSLLFASQMCDNKQEPHALGTAGVHSVYLTVNLSCSSFCFMFSPYLEAPNMQHIADACVVSSV